MEFKPYAKNQVLITNLYDNGETRTFDVSNLVENLQYSTILMEAGKLTFNLHKDTLGFSTFNGSKIQFKRDDVGIFQGNIFKMGTDATDIYKIVAYDQMRYLKYEDVLFVNDITVSDLFIKICTIFQLNNYKVVTPCNYKVPKKVYKGNLMDILKEQIRFANYAEGKQYFIRDNFGVLEFNEYSNCKTELVIGDGSLLTSYQYEIGIDNNTYNQLVFYKEDGKSKKLLKKVVKDSGTQKRWGVLQKVFEIPENQNEEQLSETAKKYLEYYNVESRTFKLSALGIDGINAGSGIIGKIEKLNTNMNMLVTAATHNYTKDMHSMELDVWTVTNSGGN